MTLANTKLSLLGSARVLVVGDVMLDRYFTGATERISPEAPVPVVQVNDDSRRLGGAANVAANLAALGVQASLQGLIGADEPGRSLRQLLEAAGISARLLESASRPTITKLRVISRHQQLIRLDFEEAFVGDAVLSSAPWLADFHAQLEQAQVLILSDYAKGTLEGAPALIAAARARGLPVVVDPKGADFSRYHGASCLTPNFKEFEVIVGRCNSEEQVIERGRRLLDELALETLLITRSEKGMTLISRDSAPMQMPTAAREVFDVTGAGDTVVAVLAAGLAVGLDSGHAARLANIAAGIVVGKLGTASVSADELQSALLEQYSHESAVLAEGELLNRVARARQDGETVVMTNGCFDLLHPGHLRYLEAARKLGDVLIVAVNDDDSVKRLKGAGRPLNSLADRMAMLAGLKSVDWVVPFGEDTPARLIGAVLPDILVKGGDYKPEDIAGADVVKAHGGAVVCPDFHNGYSTSALIERAREH